MSINSLEKLRVNFENFPVGHSEHSRNKENTRLRLIFHISLVFSSTRFSYTFCLTVLRWLIGTTLQHLLGWKTLARKKKLNNCWDGKRLHRSKTILLVRTLSQIIIHCHKYETPPQITKHLHAQPEQLIEQLPRAECLLAWLLRL